VSRVSPYGGILQESKTLSGVRGLDVVAADGR